MDAPYATGDGRRKPRLTGEALLAEVRLLEEAQRGSLSPLELRRDLRSEALAWYYRAFGFGLRSPFGLTDSLDGWEEQQLRNWHKFLTGRQSDG